MERHAGAAPAPAAWKAAIQSCYTNAPLGNPKHLNFELPIRLIYYIQFFSFCQEKFFNLLYHCHQVQNTQYQHKYSLYFHNQCLKGSYKIVLLLDIHQGLD